LYIFIERRQETPLAVLSDGEAALVGGEECRPFGSLNAVNAPNAS